MIKWWNSITFKLFILVFIILIMIISFTYTILYFFLPSFYYDYKIEQVEQQTHLLLEESSSLTMQQFKEKLFYFSEQTGAYVTLADDVAVYSSFPFDNDDLFASKKDIVNNDFNAPSTNIEADEWNQSVSSIYYIDSENDETMYTNKEDVHLKNGILSLFISLPLQSMDDVSQSLIKFIPYIVTISFLLSIIFAFIFSKLITKPFIKLQHVAKRMGNLDFTQKANIKRHDELGELASSLNAMSTNLEKSFTQLNEANRQLLDDVEKTKREEKRRRDFVATISHELKSPITAVMFHLEAMIKKVGPYKDRDIYLKKSYEIMEDMKEMSDDILHITTSEQLTQLETKTQKINLSNLFMQRINKQEQYHLSDATLNKNIRENLYIKSNAALLERVIDNIIVNAFNYCQPDGNIVFNLRKVAEQIVLEVCNECKPIKQDDFQHIFEPFYRIEKSRSRYTGGSGLGLYFVSETLKQLNLNYSFQNKTNGVIFSIIFDKDT